MEIELGLISKILIIIIPLYLASFVYQIISRAFKKKFPLTKDRIKQIEAIEKKPLLKSKIERFTSAAIYIAGFGFLYPALWLAIKYLPDAPLGGSNMIPGLISILFIVIGAFAICAIISMYIVCLAFKVANPKEIWNLPMKYYKGINDENYFYSVHRMQIDTIEFDKYVIWRLSTLFFLGASIFITFLY